MQPMDETKYSRDLDEEFVKVKNLNAQVAECNQRFREAEEALAEWRKRLIECEQKLFSIPCIFDLRRKQNKTKEKNAIVDSCLESLTKNISNTFSK